MITCFSPNWRLNPSLDVILLEASASVSAPPVNSSGSLDKCLIRTHACPSITMASLVSISNRDSWHPKLNTSPQETGAPIEYNSCKQSPDGRDRPRLTHVQLQQILEISALQINMAERRHGYPIRLLNAGPAVKLPVSKTSQQNNTLKAPSQSHSSSSSRTSLQLPSDRRGPNLVKQGAVHPACPTVHLWSGVTASREIHPPRLGSAHACSHALGSTPRRASQGGSSQFTPGSTPGESTPGG